jgi:hypothetical protein
VPTLLAAYERAVGPAAVPVPVAGAPAAAREARQPVA